MPSGPGPIPEELISDIVATIPSHIDTFLLTSKQDARDVIEQQRRTKVTTLQLVDTFPTNKYSILRKELPGIKIVQVIHVRNLESVEEAAHASLYVDALLLDSGNPGLKVKELGGTGRVHDWNISRKIQNSIKIPLYLAGGLTPDNVSEAIRVVKPYAVDICSGVRTNGYLDEHKLQRFFTAVR